MEEEIACKESYNFGDLPDLTLLKIFEYLPTAADIVYAGRVCTHWHAVSKHTNLWKIVTVNWVNMERDQMYNFFLSIPPCVTYLKLVNCVRKQISSFLDSKSLFILREKFENLETLIIEKFVLLFYFPENIFEIDHIPSTVKIISFRGSVLHPEDFFHNKCKRNIITVVDLSFCSSIDGNDLSFFNQMTSLRELYFTGCLHIGKYGIMHLFTRNNSVEVQMNLKVLDLEETKVDDFTISRLYHYLPYLEKLYLNKTKVTFNWLKDLAEENYSDEIYSSVYPFLTELCVKNTKVQYKTLLTLGKFKSMKYIDIIPNNDVKDNISNLNVNLKRKFRIHDEMERDNRCNHFTKKYGK